MEKAINSSMPKGQSSEGREGEGMSGDISERGRYEGGRGREKKSTILLFPIQSTGTMRMELTMRNYSHF